MNRIFTKITVFCTVLMSVASLHATHFRFAHITWRRIGGTASRTVEFTVTEAWRATAVTPQELVFQYGDGTGSFDISLGYTTIATLTDVAGEAYTIIRKAQTHTYSTDGPFTLQANSCCRISSLINAGDASENIRAVVDLRNGNQGSPVSSIPVMLQMGIGPNSVALPIADPDLDPYTVRLSTTAESSIPSQPRIGSQVVSVTPGGILNWDTTGGIVGDKYALQVMIQENHPGGASGLTPLDFIIELIASVNQPPVTACPGTSSYTIPSGTPLNLSFTGTDPEGGILKVDNLGLPPGATFTPTSGSLGASPLTANFSWTPTFADRGSAYAVTVVFTDVDGAQGTCSFSVAVPADSAPNVDCGGDVLLTSTAPYTTNFSITDDEGDDVSYKIFVDGVLQQSSFGPVSTFLSLPFTHSYPLGVHTFELQASDFFFTSSCFATITVADTSEPETHCGVRPLASGLILTPSATDDFDPAPKLWIRDSVSGFTAGPYNSGDRIIVRRNPTALPSVSPQPGYAGRVQIQGSPLVFASDNAGNNSTPAPVPH